MNILHITDFHYTRSNQLQIKVIQSIISTIQELKSKIDLVFFTGDLVQAGDNLEIFNEASDMLFNEISKKLDVPKENIIFCPGNHDINRELIHSAAQSYFDRNIISNDTLNHFYSNKNDSMYIDSLKPSSNYMTFLKSYHNESIFNIYKDLYSIFYRYYDNEKIGIISVNSAWISAIDKESEGKNDKGNLLIPVSALNEIKTYLRDVKKKIILIHHPLYFLKEFNFNEVENFIHDEFDLMFYGHVHKTYSNSGHSGTNGIFEHVAKASLSSKESLGCSLVELDDVEENLIHVKELTYIEDDQLCHVGQEIIYTIPCGIEKTKMISFRKKIFDKIPIEKDNANKLLLLKENEEQKDFLSLYNHPVLKRNSENGVIESSKENGVVKSNSAIITLDNLISGNNYIILGKDKCGKTSLLKRIQLYCLMNYSKFCIVPFYVDAKEYESKVNYSVFALNQLIKNDFRISNEKVERIIQDGDLILLIDNYVPNSGFANYLNTFLLVNKTVKYIICSENNLTRSIDLFKVGETIYEKLFFHDLRRQEIIAYTEKRLTINQPKEAIQEKIIQLCKQLELPLNYWTISLLILIYNKSSDSYSKNLFSILDICVDEIFGKKQLLITQSRISFEQLKTICAELAKYLFLEHESTVYSASSSDIISFIGNFISENDRISTDGYTIFNYFLECGILKLKEADLYVFRLNGFFEYFLAYQMTKDNDFKSKIIKDSSKYLGVKNELEIYSGFKRDDIDFLQTIYRITQEKVDPIFNKYSQNKDNELSNKINMSSKIEDFCQKISIPKALSVDQKAKIEDAFEELQINSDVHLIEKCNPSKINSEVLERYIIILSRVFRNLDEIQGYKNKQVEIFDKIIDYYCDLGFYIVDDFSNMTKEEMINNGASSELDLLNFISNYSPLITQTFLYDGIGHYNMERMIKDKIQKLGNIAENNQYKLFMLYFLLLDIDINANKEYIQIAIDNIKNPVLKYLIIIKLNYYLAFKVTNNKLLQNELSKEILETKMRINNKYDKREIQRQIQTTKKQSHINKNKIW
jgi:predicted phosphodiesterase